MINFITIQDPSFRPDMIMVRVQNPGDHFRRCHPAASLIRGMRQHDSWPFVDQAARSVSYISQVSAKLTFLNHRNWSLFVHATALLHSLNALILRFRYCSALTRCLPRLNRFWTAAYAVTNRYACLVELKLNSALGTCLPAKNITFPYRQA